MFINFLAKKAKYLEIQNPDYFELFITLQPT
jgi:hypothetical protein